HLFRRGPDRGVRLHEPEPRPLLRPRGRDRQGRRGPARRLGRPAGREPMKVHLVDGTYELFRAHFGAPPATGLDGTAVGATRGLLHTLLALLASPGAPPVACASVPVSDPSGTAWKDGTKAGEGLPP